MSPPVHRTRRATRHEDSSWNWRKPARILVRALAAQSLLTGLDLAQAAATQPVPARTPVPGPAPQPVPAPASGPRSSS